MGPGLLLGVAAVLALCSNSNRKSPLFFFLHSTCVQELDVHTVTHLQLFKPLYPAVPSETLTQLEVFPQNSISSEEVVVM